MEGIRQEEIESVMFEMVYSNQACALRRLHENDLHKSVPRARLDPSKDDDREYLEELIRLELQQVETGKLKQTEMFGVFRRIK